MRLVASPIPSLMIFNLEIQKIMHRIQSVMISGHDPHSAAGGQLLKAVGNFGTFVLRLRYAGWNLAVHEHGDGEVAVREHGNDVRKMRPDGLQVCGVMAVVDRDFNRSAVR